MGASTVSAEDNQGYQGWSPIKQKPVGYAVISNYQGMDVPPGQTVWVTAGTTNLTIKSVVFVWKYPNDSKAWEETVNVIGPISTPNVPSNVHQEVVDWANNLTGDAAVQYLYAQSVHQPTVIGDWGVQALFIGEGGHPVNSIKNVIAIRATSFNMVPDLPVVGTAGALVTMLFGLGLFLHKKRH
ncbi:MAG: hypothetical protein ACPLRY_05220 [Candidatus Bathyarchaeales archaeon]